MYLFSYLKYEVQRISAIATWPGNCRYLFFYLKYEVWRILATDTWPGGCK